jgi:hypothetical protein
MSGHHPFDQLRARMTPERRAQHAATTQAVLAALPQQAQPPQEPDAALLPESEQPVVLAYQPPPVQRLAGVVRLIRPSEQTLALTDDAWHTLGLEDAPEA